MTEKETKMRALSEEDYNKLTLFEKNKLALMIVKDKDFNVIMKLLMLDITTKIVKENKNND